MNHTVDINFSRAALRFINKNSHIISEQDINTLLVDAVKYLLKVEPVNIDVKKLSGNLKGYYRIRTGKIRIIFGLTKDNEIIILDVDAIDYRGDVYK